MLSVHPTFAFSTQLKLKKEKKLWEILTNCGKWENNENEKKYWNKSPKAFFLRRWIEIMTEQDNDWISEKKNFHPGCSQEEYKNVDRKIKLEES